MVIKIVLIVLALTISGTLSMLPFSMYTGKIMRVPRAPTLESKASDYTYKTMYVTQRVDNFGFGSDETFQQKVLYSDKHWVPGGPILLYAGNEGKIELFVRNSGYLWDLEPVLNALVLFAEHRYYGESLPYGDESYSSRLHLAHFTADQAMADFAMLIRHIKTTWPGAENSKVIVFGGSYGAMMAAWLRMKYPDVFDGAISSSGPIWGFTWPCDSYVRVVTQVFVKHGSENCRRNIRNSWGAVDELGKTADGKRKLASIFGACKASLDDVNAVKAHMEGAFATVAAVNYPYEAGFYSPLPPWPIREMCKVSGLNDQLFTEKEDLLKAISRATNVFYNYSGSAGPCNHIGEPSEEEPDVSGIGWGYQSCTEMTIPQCRTGIDDMFEPSPPWSDSDAAESCAKMFYGVRPNPNWTEVTYWGKRIESASNIVFANGLLDPWSAGAPLKSISPYMPVVVIPDGAHHLELRAANPLDTPAAKAARAVETAWIKRWIGQAP